MQEPTKNNTLKNSIEKNTLVFLIIISLLFWALRLTYIDQQKDSIDQERDYNLTVQHMEGGEFQYSGPRFGHEIRIPSVLYHWTLSLPLMINKSMLSLRIFIVLSNFLTMLLIFLVARWMFNDTTALIAAGTFTFAPFAVKYSVFLWNPNFTPLFAIMVFYFLWRCIKHDGTDGSKLSLALIVTVYFGLSFHIASLAYILLLIVAWYFFKVRWNLPYSLLGIILVILMTIVHFYFDWKNDFANLNAPIFTPGKKGYGLEALKSLQWLILYPSNEVSSLIEKGFDKSLELFDFPHPYFWISLLLFPISCILPLLSYITLCRTEYKILKKMGKHNYFLEKRPETLLIFFLFCVPIFLILFGRGGVPRYITLNSPALFLSLAWFLNYLIQKYPQHQKWIWGYLIVQMMNQAYLYYRLEPLSRLNS